MFDIFMNQSFLTLACVLFSHCKGDFLTQPPDQSFSLASSIENGLKPFRHSQGFEKLLGYCTTPNAPHKA
jgi:hypothetical protein